MSRQNISSGGNWEPLVGYSRAVRVGNHIRVAGTTATDENGTVVGIADPHAQAVYIFNIIEKALSRAGASMKDVVATRMYVIDIEHWEDVGRAHREFFADIRPAATLVAVNRLVEPEMLVEIEVEAIVSD